MTPLVALLIQNEGYNAGPGETNPYPVDSDVYREWQFGNDMAAVSRIIEQVQAILNRQPSDRVRRVGNMAR